MSEHIPDFDDFSPEQLADLREKICKYYDVTELMLLCQDVGVDYEDLSGPSKVTKVYALIGYMGRQKHLPNLYSACQKTRPDVAWKSSDRQPMPDAPEASAEAKSAVQKPLTPLEKWIRRKGVQHWDRLFEENEDKAMSDLHKIAQELTVASSTLELPSAEFEDLLCGYTAYVKRRNRAYHERILIDGVKAYLEQLKHNRQRRAE